MASDKHEKRSQKIADKLRAALLALATGGIAATYAVSDRVSDRRIWIAAAAFFVFALLCILISWFAAKHRALKRRDAAAAGTGLPRYKWWSPAASWPWDIATACALVAGAASLALGLWLQPVGAEKVGRAFASLMPWATDVAGNLFLTLAATGFGAWFGGAAAFRGERKKREQDRRIAQATAVSRVLFMLFRFHQIVAKVAADFLPLAEKDIFLTFVQKPTLDSGWHSPRIDVSSLDFLHSTREQMVLVELLDCDNEFQIIGALVRERSRMVEEWIKPLAEKYPMQAPDGSPGFDLNAIVASLGVRRREDLAGVSRELQQALKRAMAVLPKTQKELADLYERVFPDLGRPLYIVLDLTKS
jgi:hypothetical protein